MAFGERSIEQLVREQWWLFGIGAAANLTFIALGWVKGPLATLWTITGVIGLAVAGWGFMLNQGMNSNYTYYYDGYYYFG